MTISLAIQVRDRQSGFLDIRPTTNSRAIQARGEARGVKLVSMSKGEPLRAVRREAPEPVLSIEEAIRRYAESQPAQLYRGGA